MSIKPSPKSPNFEQSTIDWAQFAESTENVTSFPHYAGKKQVILASGTGTVFLQDSDNIFHVKNIGTGTITVEPETGTIDGAATRTMSTQYESIGVVFDGQNWHVI